LPLQFCIELKALTKVEDVYRDGTTFHKTLVKGQGSASPYTDFQIICKQISLTVLSKGED